MKTVFVNLAMALVLGLQGNLLVSPGAVAQAQKCLSNIELQEAIASGEVASLDAVLEDAGIGSETEVVSAKVCDTGGQLEYVIGLIGPEGYAQKLVLPAGN